MLCGSVGEDMQLVPGITQHSITIAFYYYPHSSPTCLSVPLNVRLSAFLCEQSAWAASNALLTPFTEATFLKTQFKAAFFRGRGGLTLFHLP